jgi:hypothetical protein
VQTPSRTEIDEAHNWCDRWCERCPLADRCSISRSAGVASSQPAMVQVAAALERALEMLEVEFAKQGLDVEEAVPPVVSQDSDELVRRALSWTHAGARWLVTAPVGEARAVVGWYHTLVPTKLHRASSSRALGSTDDAAGSAKVASLGLASVVDALTSHCQRAPQDSAGLALLVDACALMEAVEESFPDHLSFRRPGFGP